MSKKFKSQASSSRAAAGGFGAFAGSFGGFSSVSSSHTHAPSSLSYVTEPPDLSRISEPQLVVAFKNLLKKDDITKTKALEDLRDYILKLENRSDSLEDGVLEAWTRVYPRTSIENSRRVRQLAHTIQGLLASLAGKRIARHLSKVIGAWLAGLYDTDRPVSRSAVESLTRVFATEEKRSSLWKVYQSPILEFVDDVILHQTASTLSDERIVKPDDAEAKFARVSATAILLFNRILSTASPQELDKDLALIHTLLSSKSLWSFSHHDDPFVRRAIYSLLRSSLAKGLDAIDWKIISGAIIGKSLSIPQLGSASEFSETLLQLTQARPQIWTTDYAGKSPAVKRLNQYIQRGSQGAAESYWPNLVQLLQTVPLELLTQFGTKTDAEAGFSYSQASSLMDAFLEGLCSRDEPRHNLKTGWMSYIDAGIWLSTILGEDDKVKFVQGHITPIFEQYITGTQGESRWTLPPQSAEEICAAGFVRLTEHGHEVTLRSLWTNVAKDLLQAVKISLPEQSKDFRPSQDAVCAKANRFFSLEAAGLSLASQSTTEPRILSIFEEASLPLLEGSLQVLHTRNGKPYGAAAMIEEAISNIPQIVKSSQTLVSFLKETIPALLFTPSAERVMSTILLCRRWDDFGSVFQEFLQRMIESELDESNTPALSKLFSMIDFKEIQDRSRLDSIVMQSLDKALRGKRTEWSLLYAVVENQTLPDSLMDRIILSILDALSSEDNVTEALFGLSQIATRSPATLRRFRKGVHGSKLLAKLLYLTESPDDEVAQGAESLEKKFKDTVSGDIGAESNIEILKHSFREIGPESLSVDSLVNIAEELLLTAKPEEKHDLANNILPSRQSWKDALEPFLGLPPRPSTAITSPLGGIVYLIDHDLPDSFWQKLESVPRDSNRSSSAFRLASYVTKVLSLPNVMESLGAEERESLFYYFPLAIQLIDDDLSIEGCTGITGLEVSEDREEYTEIVNQGRSIIHSWIHSDARLNSESGNSLSEELFTFWERALESLEDTSPESYRVGEAFAKIMSEAETRKSTKTMDSLAGLLKEIRKTNVVRAAATLVVWRHSIMSNPAGTRLCNELVADVTGFNSQKDPIEGLHKLSLLNILIQGEENVVASIPTQRLVFLVKHLIQCVQSGLESINVEAEIFKVLTVVLRLLSEIYGSHWADTIEILISTWKETSGGDEALPALHASFRLFASIKSMANGEGNDDLEDAWKESKAELVKSLVSTLHKLDSSSAFHQPRDMTADLLRRQLSTVPVDSLPGVNDLFPLLAAQSRGIQRAAYEVLHRFIPQAQQQVSFDVALTKTTVNLPDELLSLLLEAPTMESLIAASGDDKAWVGLRSYLLSWKIVFDHFSNSSLPVQENYVSNIKEHGSLNPLLDFTFDFLQKSHGKLLDASKFDIRSFEPDESDSAKKETQWLLVHLYFLSLKYLANLTKTWWIDSKKRIKGPVESWTEKYISPLIIEDALTSVSEWMTTQDPDEERPLSVKISVKAAELVASIPVDEESPPVAMVISLPPAYPLQPALVTGRSRVLVDEKKWRSWMLTIQGVIMFSNGNLVDGLLAFRKNVQGALKGQSECAICYSVISTDMQTPNKRCATCKNTFHSVCLFRWFKSSNQSTCPLCRNNFVYV
ncbi:hypothetical protein VTN77DRAFT_7690 [Rasamsonia byssochlamydoides]|uniref:uncharacterized protein n=1 Tax=Rasamsonia byssochlamydoides TaxID=89139 RepID=UPI0037449B8C